MAIRSIVIAHGGDLSDATGGTNRIIAFALALQNGGYDTHLVVSKPKKDLPKCLEQIKVHTIPIKEKGIHNQLLRAFLISLKSKNLAKKYNAILQIELSTLGGIATLIGCSNFILDVNDISIDDPQYRNLPFPTIVQRFIYAMEKRAVLCASKSIVVSAPMGEFLEKEWGISRDSIEVIPNGYFESALVNINNNETIDEKMIVTLGTLFNHLDLNLIIRLAKAVADQNMKIYLVGDGVLRPHIEERIRQEKINNIIITGWLPYPDAMRFINKALFVFHTIKRSITTEVACPVKILDYAALGKPMILSDVSELSKEMKNKGLALVSDPENEEEFEDNIKALLENKETRESMSRNLKIFAKDFTWTKQGQKLVNLYASLK